VSLNVFPPSEDGHVPVSRTRLLNIDEEIRRFEYKVEAALNMR